MQEINKEFKTNYAIMIKYKKLNNFREMIRYGLYSLEAIKKILNLSISNDDRKKWNEINNIINTMIRTKQPITKINSIDINSCLSNSIFAVDTNTSTATCFFIGKAGNEYYFVTNRHVVDGESKFVIRNNDRSFVVKAKVHDINNKLDIAVLSAKIEYPTFPLVPMMLAESDKVIPGMPIYLIGNKSGLGISFLAGHVAGEYNDSNLLDINSGHGDSGSPIIDEYGSVIGILWGRYMDLEVSTGENLKNLKQYLVNLKLPITIQNKVKY